MKMLNQQLIKLFAAMMIAGVLAACGSMHEKQASAEKAQDAVEIYEVHHDGRIHVFYDKKLYLDFLALGETPFRLTQIGAGPNGETVVYGLTKQDKKKPEAVTALQVYEGKLPEPVSFYGELRNHGRIYVFNDLQDMKPVRQFGHPNFFFMEVGGGPKGETVVYVLNEKTKKKRPEALIARFKQENKLM